MLLVVLPMLALAVVGWVSLERDRAEVERVARDRARVSAERWIRVLGQAPVGAEPQGADHGIELAWDEAGELVRPPRDFEAPLPPAWVGKLSSKQGEGLDAVRAGFATRRWEEVAAACRELQEADGLPPEPKAVVEWAGLEARMASGDGAGGDTIPRALSLGREALEKGWRTESGVPLAPLVALGLFRPQAGEAWRQIPETWLRELIVGKPSVLSGTVLSAWRGRAAGRVTEVERELARDRLARSLAERLPLAVGTNGTGVMPGCRWVVGDGADRWLAWVQRGPGGARARLVPATAVGRRLREAVDRAGDPGWSEGLSARLEVAGEVESGLGPVAGFGGGRAGADVVAEAEGLVPWAGEAGGPIPVRVRVELVEPDRLFAAQRRQRRLFAGLLAGAMGVAGLGLWRTHRAFERERALAEARSNFVSAVSHELRAPLASMRLLAEALEQGRVEEASKRHEYAGFLVQETRRLGTLVENVLDSARIDQGRKRYEFEPLDLERLIAETVRIPAPLAEERGVRLVLRMPGGGPPGGHEVVGDAAALQQVLLNLLDNALKHAPSGSAVEVGLSCDGSGALPVRITVHDEGPGIPPAEQERIFERFYRLGSELRRETQGVGLGLALVRHAVEAHGGRVTVSSQPGAGAEFRVELPWGTAGGADADGKEAEG